MIERPDPRCPTRQSVLTPVGGAATLPPQSREGEQSKQTSDRLKLAPVARFQSSCFATCSKRLWRQCWAQRMRTGLKMIRDAGPTLLDVPDQDATPIATVVQEP